MNQRHAFQPAPPNVVGIDGSDALFPVRRVDWVGFNDADQVQEMGVSPVQRGELMVAHAAHLPELRVRVA